MTLLCAVLLAALLIALWDRRAARRTGGQVMVRNAPRPPVQARIPAPPPRGRR